MLQNYTNKRQKMRRQFNQDLLKRILPVMDNNIAMHDWYHMQLVRYNITTKELAEHGINSSANNYNKNEMRNIMDDRLIKICNVFYQITGISYKEFYKSAIQFKQHYRIPHDKEY